MNCTFIKQMTLLFAVFMCTSTIFAQKPGQQRYFAPKKALPTNSTKPTNRLMGNSVYQGAVVKPPSFYTSEEAIKENAAIAEEKKKAKLAQSSNQLMADEKCGFIAVQEMHRKNHNIPSTQQFEQWMERQLTLGNYNESRAVKTIPVVVHVVHGGEEVGAGNNISDEQVFSQIEILNADFRRANSDALNTPEDFIGVAVDTELEFCLATVDPDGNPINGIHRYNGGKTAYTTTEIEENVKCATAWNPEYYFNIWVIPVAGNILGYAQFPSMSGLSGMPTDGGPDYTDGIVVIPSAFGNIGTATAPYNLGRTATHEVGHFFGLRHIWGDGGCSVDDFCDDTPIQGAPNYTDNPCTYPDVNSCNEAVDDLPDQFMNYMDYSADACMNLFTQDQKARIDVVLANSPRRSYAESQVCEGIKPADWECELPPPPPAPENDLCADAVTINCGDTVDGTTAGATSNGAPGFCVTSVGAPGVWYTFIGDGRNVTLSTCDQANFDTKINVYAGTCGSLICEAGNDDGFNCTDFYF